MLLIEGNIDTHLQHVAKCFKRNIKVYAITGVIKSPKDTKIISIAKIFDHIIQSFDSSELKCESCETNEKINHIFTKYLASFTDITKDQHTQIINTVTDPNIYTKIHSLFNIKHIMLS